jgi:putative hydrolase of the HAD superfamily/5'-nucleotidase
MKSYDWILFDADDTLFHVDAFGGLRRMFAGYDTEFTEQHYLEYQEVNVSLWVDYQNGAITAKQLQHTRFNNWAEKLQTPAQQLNTAYMAALADISTPLDGANSLLHALKGRARLGIITNGFTALQQVRLERTGLRHHFDVLVVSEEVGVAKPHRDIFDHALTLMGQPARNNVLMVGDNPDSDIAGGLNAGLQTCWLNVNNRPVPAGITPHFQVSSLHELEKLLTANG